MDHEVHVRQEITEILLGLNRSETVIPVNLPNSNGSDTAITENLPDLNESETLITDDLPDSNGLEVLISDNLPDSNGSELLITENLPNLNSLETVITVRSVQGEDKEEEEGRTLKSDAEMERKVCVEDTKVKIEAGSEASVIDVKYSRNLSSRDEGEKICRICHLSSDRRSSSSDMIELGCKCKDDLGTAHRHCAEAWFKIKGNRFCEICSETAKNITGVGDVGFMQEWHGRERGSSSSSSSERGSCWRSQPLCNFLMACMVIAFILPWFFRVNMF